MDFITLAAAQAIATIALNHFVEGGAGELGKQLSSAIAANVNQKVTKLGELVWEKIKGNPKTVAVLEAAENEPAQLTALQEELEPLWQDEDSEFVQRVQQLVQEIHQDINIGQQQGRNVMNVAGGSALQVNDPQAPVIHARDNNTFNIT